MEMLYEMVCVVATLLLVPMVWCRFNRTGVGGNWIVSRLPNSRDEVRFLTPAY